jgi:hypothetical protein
MKSKVVAALLSALVLPGAGQWYLGRRPLALVFVGVALASGFVYAMHALDQANAVVDQVMSGKVALDPEILAAQIEAQPTPAWIAAAGYLFIGCWVGSIVEVLLGKVGGAPPAR